MPIIQEYGRWRSVRTPDERKTSALELVEKLNPRERVMLQKILSDYRAAGRSEIAREVAEIEWDEQPLPVAEWLMNEELVGETGKDMYPQLRDDMVELFEGDYHEAILTGAIGWGKDFFATTACLRMLYELNCLKNPQHTLGLAQGEPIHIVPISKTIASARRVVFGGICKKLALANWFRGKYEETMEEVRFKKKGIYIVGGASQDAAALGLNVIFAIIDESNFLGEGKVTTGSASAKAEDKATMIYNALARRVKARYKRHGVRGLIMLISSKRSTSDFTEKRIHNAIKEADQGTFVRDYAIWNVHPEPFKNQAWYRVSVNPTQGRCKLLEHETDVPMPGSLVFKFPEDYLDEFRNDPDGATRDIAGIATDFIGRPFITHRPMIDKMFATQRVSPFAADEWYTNTMLKFQWQKVMTQNANGEPIPICCPGSVRHVAIDMSVNQCATGTVVAHIAGKTEVERRDPETHSKIIEWAPVIHVDGVLRALAPDGGDIDHGEIRGIIYNMIASGYPIRSVSMDQFMAPPNLQLFKKRGLRTAEVGARTAFLKPYMTLRQAIYEDRITIPKHLILNKELRELEIDDKAMKIKHPLKGSKDLADALSNAVYYLSEHGQLGEPLGPSFGVTTRESTGKTPLWSEGNTIWPDEEEEATLEPRSPSPPPDKADRNEGFSSWIV